jgi:MYXO-CTERM domain-containing protein
MKSIKSLFAVTAVALAVLTVPVANATYSATFQGATFNINSVDSNTFTFQILGANALTDNWFGANFLAAFDFKGLGVDFTQSGVSAAAKYEPSGPSTPGLQAQLNANECNTNVGETGSICFDPVPNIAVAATMLFTIDITGATLNFASAGPHLQIMFSKDEDKTDCKTDQKTGVETCNDNKLGSLYSEDIPFSSSSSGSSSSGISSTSSSSGISSTSSGNAPEPNSGAMAVLGLGLMAGGFAWRRRANRS